jgi:hypothetical protein
MTANSLTVNHFTLGADGSGGIVHSVPIPTLYQLFTHPIADSSVRFAMLPIAAQFLCSFGGKYLYFIAGGMHI